MGSQRDVEVVRSSLPAHIAKDVLKRAALGCSKPVRTSDRGQQRAQRQTVNENEKLAREFEDAMGRDTKKRRVAGDIGGQKRGERCLTMGSPGLSAPDLGLLIRRQCHRGLLLVMAMRGNPMRQWGGSHAGEPGQLNCLRVELRRQYELKQCFVARCAGQEVNYMN